jgi:hypothetical protein
MAEWVIDRLSGNRFQRGGSGGGKIVKGTIDTLVKESAQNPKDQPLDPKIPVKIRYVLFELSGKERSDFLNSMDWENLEKHIASCADEAGETGSLLREGLKKIKTGKKLRLLRVEDSYAKGLQGDDFERKGNFNLLCRSNLKTSDQDKRGGSHGIGKSVYWKFSCISTVLMGSLVKGEEDKGVRLFGRTDIPSHDIKNKEYDSGGFFGDRKKDETEVPYAQSIFGNQTLAEALYLERNGLNTGTTLEIVGFDEPEFDRVRSMEEISEDIIESAERWFWPSMTGGNPSVEIEAVIEENGVLIYRKEADPYKNWAPFIRAREKEITVKTAKEPGDIAGTKLSFKVPKSNDPDNEHKQFDTDLTLKVIRTDESMANHEKCNSIAVFRGANIIVKYTKARRRPLDGKPFFGVLMAGNTAGDSIEYGHAETFFRSSEPPLHDNWEYSETIKSDYAIGGKTRIEELWRGLSDEVLKLINEAISINDKGLNSLSKLFSLGKEGSPIIKQKSKRNISKAVYINGKWEIEGEAICAKFKQDPWNVSIGFTADTDSGKGESMIITSLTTSSPKAVVTDLGPPATVAINGDIDRFSFNATAKGTSILKQSDLNLTAIKFSH